MQEAEIQLDIKDGDEQSTVRRWLYGDEYT